MNENTAATAATLEELAAEVAHLRARLDANELLARMSLLDEMPQRPRLRVISCYTGRKRTAPRGRLRLAT
jgi:hypothetical protein